jgi:GT2 family glycosyltransferase
MKLAVIIATLGRPVEVGQLLASLRQQTRPADSIILSVVSDADLPSDLAADIIVVKGSKGLPAQRNRGMAPVLADHDVVAFFDDDYLASRFALEGLETFFAAHPDVGGTNGWLLADGVNLQSLGYEDAVAMIDAQDAMPRAAPKILELLPNGLYGCNMAYRVSAIGQVRFDERMPLYGWQEDLDFSVQVGRVGRLVKSDAFWGVHRGVKGARTSGVKFGYSQIVNPLYMWRKGTMTLRYALRLAVLNLVANHAKSLKPEPWIDRHGRLRGNWMAMADLARGRCDPERILSIT